MDIAAMLAEEHSQEISGELLALGFGDINKALVNVRLIAEGVEEPLFLELLPSLVRACSMTSDPDACLNNFERVSSAFPSREGFLGLISWQPEGVKYLAPLLASSQFLTRHILGDPEELLAWLLSGGRLDGPRERDEFIRECLRACPPETSVLEAVASLRRFKYKEFLRITVRDLLGRATLSETTLELSNLADAALEAALRVAQHELDTRYGPPCYAGQSGRKKRCPFTVVAMGKLGGRELNFSSDIDVMYLYLTGDGGHDRGGKLTNHQYFVKLAELIGKLIGEKTEDGFVFRVDTRLRPEGERGDLAQSLGGYEIYYESWGQTWERSALIKARPCAGDMDLGRKFTETIRPFVFRKYLDYSAIGEIRDMKRKVEKGAGKRGREVDLKLGPGGIREIEFFISALQLIYGGRDPGIRERGTLKALHRLALRNLITFEEQRALAKAYEFLRTAEHRLQVVDERQVHSFAPTPEETRALARRMGYTETPGFGAGEKFMADYARHMKKVRSIYDGLFSEQAVDVAPAEGGYDPVLSAETSEEDAAAALAEKGFKRPHQAFRDVLLLRDGSPGSPLTPRSRNLFMKILPALLDGCVSSPDPDMALSRLESFTTSFGSREGLYDLIAERPDAPGQLAKVFGSSEYFSRLLISHPEMSDVLLLTGEEGLDRPKAELALELSAELKGAESFAAKMDLLRRFKHTEEIRVGIKDIIKSPGWREVSSGLTALAEVMLDETLKAAADDLGAKHGLPKGFAKGGGAAIAGMGKLGAGELGYGSDLDIIFLYEGADANGGGMGTPEFAARLAERVIFALSSLTRDGFAFRVDTRLRPGGSKGVLAHTIDGLREYYKKSASVWELQALTRARCVAGGKELCRSFEGLRREVLLVPREKERLASAVKAMRARMEKELGRKHKYHIKYGRGGIVDIEFVVQYLQLLHAHAHPEILSADTSSALERITGIGLVAAEDGGELKGAYTFMKELESKLRITTSQPETALPEDADRLTVLANRMGYPGRGEEAAKALISDYERQAKTVREIYGKILAGQEA